MANQILATFFFTLFALCGWTWLRLYWRGRPLLAWSRRTESPWTFLEVGSSVLLLIGYLVICSRVALHFGYELGKQDAATAGAEEISVDAACTSVAFVLTVLSVIGLTRLLHGATAADWGFCRRTVLTDVGLGVIGYVALAPPVLIVMAVLSRFVEPEHDITTLLTKARDPVFFLVAGISAVVVAPIVEELLFRVLLQGWFERLERLAAAWRERHAKPGNLVHGGTTEPNEYSSFAENESNEVAGDEESNNVGKPAVWPILASSTLFAAAHWGNGPSPVPLFFLALGLGYMYQRTHRVIPCIVTHMLLNGVTLTMIFLIPPEAAG